MLEDLKQVQPGDNVLVLVSSSDELDGFLRYKGPISSQEPATIFGIELVNNPGVFYIGVTCPFAQRNCGNWL